MKVKLFDQVGDFAGDKDVAKELRENRLMPALRKGHEVEIDFNGVELATQSFVHALISDLIRHDDLDALEQLVFANCNESVKTIISIVVDYSQEDVLAEPEGSAEGEPA